VIVGSGIAGLAAAEAIRERAATAAITMVSEEAHRFYSRPGLAYLLRGDIPEKQLYVRTREDLRALNVHRVAARVEQLVPSQRELLLAGGRRLRYDRLLLATGATAVPPPFPGGGLVGVVKLDSLDDARHILSLARRRRPAVVVGGGITALELVEGLAARRMHVQYLMRSARYWSDVLDETESRLVLERLRAVGVIIRHSTQVKQALGAGGRLTGVQTHAGDTIPCELLAVAIGVRPRVELARAAGLAVSRAIQVNEFLETSSPDVFAAGDAAEVDDPHSGHTTLDVLWSTALAQGRVAGANMAGARRAYIKGIPFNVTQLAGLRVTIIGAVGQGKDHDLTAIARGDSEAWRLAPRCWVTTEQDDGSRVRVLVGDKRIVGAVVMGEQTWSRPLQRLIVAEADISPVRPALLGDSGTALRHLAGFYEQWERAIQGQRPAPAARRAPS
jgi:NAD(P)H-nitrite reductase large subunit